MRMLCVLALLAAITSAACQSSSRAGAQRSVEVRLERLQFVLGDDTPNDHFPVTHEGPHASPIYMSTTPYLTEYDMKQITDTECADGSPGLLIRLTDSGTQKLLANPNEYVDRMFIVVWDGDVIATPRIHTPLASKVMICSSDTLSPDKLDEIAAYVRSVNH